MDNPLRTALKIFDAAVRGAFDMAAAFWRPFLRQPKKQESPAIEHTKAPASTEEETSPAIRRRQKSKPLPRKPTVEKKLEPATPPSAELTALLNGELRKHQVCAGVSVDGITPVVDDRVDYNRGVPRVSRSIVRFFWSTVAII
jgi:hypothetical protein